MKRYLTAAALLTVLLCLPTAAAQSPPRQRIGLALSGGGARGFAHLGVLEWFEQHRIPVDYIAGTSMGGLVGGLYAMGMDAAEIREFSRTLDWDRLLSPAPPYDDLTLRRREDSEDFPAQLELGWKGGLTTADALISGHAVRLVFDRLTLPYGELTSFDELPIPYRAVAVDLVSGQRIVMREGSLSLALGATMAIPGIFQPVATADQLLVDGGILDNLPADEVQAMGADLVIAVDVGTPLSEREELGSFLSVLDQMIGVMMLEKVRRSRQAADVLITPSLDGFTSADFGAAEQIIERGHQAAEVRAAILQGLSLSPSEWQRHLEDRRRRRRLAAPAPTRLSVSAPRPETRTKIERELDFEPGRPVETDEVEQTLNLVRGEGRLARLGYGLGDRQGETTLLVDAQEKSHGPPFINLGVFADNTETDDVSFTVAGRLTFLDLGRYRAEWRTDFAVGSRLGIFSEYYYPLAAGFFVAPRLFADRTTANLFEGGLRLSEYKTSQAGGGFDLGWGVGYRRNEVRLGLQLGSGDAEVRVGDPLLPDVGGTVSAARVRWRHNRLDAAVVPTAGWSLDWTGHWYFQSPGVERAFPQSELRVSGFVPLGRSSSIVLRGAGGTTFDRTAPPLQQFTLGGPFRVGGLGAGELRGSRYLLLSPGYRRRVGTLPSLIGGPVHLFVWYEVGSVFEPRQQRDYVHSGSIGVITETLLGPIFVGGSWAEGGRAKVYFSVGRLF